jgi:hypothetical protein
MFASGPAILSALFLIQAEAQFEAGARIESRVGETPTGTTQGTSTSPTTGQPVTGYVTAEQAQVMVAATPLLSLRWLGGVDDVRADSATRILWRPVPLIRSRPIFLETLGASLTRRPSRRSTWQFNILGSYGEQDYTSLQNALPNQPTLPLTTTMFMVDATAGASWRSTRRTTLALQFGAIHRRSFDAQSDANGSAGTIGRIPTQSTVSAVPGLDFALTRRSSLQAFATVSDTDVQNPSPLPGQPSDQNILLIQPQVGLREELARRHQLHLAVGLSYAVALRQTDTPLPWYPWPLLQVELNSLLSRTRTAIVRSSLGAGTTAFVDIGLGEVVWRGVAQASVDTQLGPWSVGTRCSFATDISGRLSAVGNVSPDETIVSAEIPVRYRSSRRLIVEFGGRYTERAPHLGAPGFAWHNRELWLFLNLTASSRPLVTRS